MKKNEYLGCFGMIVGLIIASIIAPVLYYFSGWITGHLLNFFIGDTIVNGMNYVFETTRFTRDMLPVTCGTLGVIGSFFKSINSVKNNG